MGVEAGSGSEGAGWLPTADGHDLVSRSMGTANDARQCSDRLGAVTAAVVEDHDGPGMQRREHPLGDDVGGRSQVIRRVDVPGQLCEPPCFTLCKYRWVALLKRWAKTAYGLAGDALE